ncbi:MAG TPA: aminomethyl-transferring glycine dehydrogenase subunit GcvPB [Actinomycetota bacterium]|nr:aminomethyl-transferring glycine dehydrogenase subunit GcvPB [Actinomycetota bacterium]
MGARRVGAPVRTAGPAVPATLRELSRPGRRAFTLPTLDVPEAAVAEEHRRTTPPGLPEVGERDLVRHFTRLAQMNYGVDTGFYPLGSCSMKYNPKVAEEVAALPGFRRLHPLQPESTVQGALALVHALESMLCEVTGMARVTFQPAAGASGELTGLLIMRGHHARNGDPRRRVVIPDSAHGTNPASVTLAGYEVAEVPSDARGLVDVSALEKLMGEDVAGLMITNPNTLGLFEEDILDIARIVHDAGGLLYYDGANLNAIMGVVRPGDMGFDIVHMNTHKTFATPHGGGGPGAGPVAVAERLVPFLPSPTVEYDEAANRHYLDHDRPLSIGRVHGFHGNFGVLVRAYAYVVAHGGDGLRAVAERAVLNANYLCERVKGRFPLAFSGRPMHEFVATAKPLRKHGIRATDVAKRLIDLGFHPSTVYFPLVVEEALMVEPTETESRETLDAFAEAMLQAAREAESDPDLLHQAPVTAPVRRLDEARAARELKLHW